MSNKFLFRFAQEISRQRRRRGVAQKVLAFNVGIDATRLSAIERGRVVGPPTELVLRVGAALELSEGDAAALAQAAAHDRVMREVVRNLAQARHQLIAVSLDAAHVLSQEDCDFLADYILRLVLPRRHLTSGLAKEGEVMT